MCYVADLLGNEAAAVLSSERGGTTIYVPSRIRRDHWLVVLLGFERFVVLVRAAGGCKLFIPRPSLQPRNRQIRRDWQQGATHATLAHRYALSERQIYRILRHGTV